MSGVNGLHHVTAIAGPAQENLDFYAGVLGMRLVKRSVNQDDPGTYHLFYADAVGSPGTDLTFFPWPDLGAPRPGHGLAVETALEIPPGTLAWWGDRLVRYGARPDDIRSRFGDRVLALTDPHGFALALVESAASPPRRFEAWQGGPVAPDRQIRGLHGARLHEREPEATAAFLVGVLGFRRIGEENGWTRFGFDHAAGRIDVAPLPGARRGAWGVGSVHHLAWRVDDEAHQLAVRAAIEHAGARATGVIDRFWFRSVYFREPGGVLFELATDGPGFGIDEDREHLGERLVLPPFLESRRARIEQALPPLRSAAPPA